MQSQDTEPHCERRLEPIVNSRAGRTSVLRPFPREIADIQIAFHVDYLMSLSRQWDIYQKKWHLPYPKAWQVRSLLYFDHICSEKKTLAS